MIFGPDEANGIRGHPKFDDYMNTFYAILIIVCFILSASLNTILFWFHLSIPTSIPSILFRILNVTDFLTTTLLCPYLVYGLLTPDLVGHNVPATPLQHIYSAVFAFLLFLSVSITTLMTATRVYAIKFPLKIMSRRVAVYYPMIAIISAAIFVVGLNFTINKTWDRYLYSTNRLKVILLKPGTNELDNWPELVYTAVLMPIAIVGCACAVITGKEVYKAMQMMKQVQGSSLALKKHGQHRSYITVLMLSAGIHVALVFVLAQFIYSLTVLRTGFPYNAYYFMYGNALFCSLVLSVVNPIITISRCSGLRQFYTDKLASKKPCSHISENTFVFHLKPKRVDPGIELINIVES